jgi:hypothetical protein
MFVGAESIPHGLYKQAKRFDFEIVDGAHRDCIVSCTIDAASNHPVYQPSLLWSALKGIDPAPLHGRRCTRLSGQSSPAIGFAVVNARAGKNAIHLANIRSPVAVTMRRLQIGIELRNGGASIRTQM